MASSDLLEQAQWFCAVECQAKKQTGRKKAFSTLSPKMGKKMQKIAFRVNCLGLKVPFFNLAALWEGLLRL